MKQITAYESSDGKLFKSEQDCGCYELYGGVDAYFRTRSIGTRDELDRFAEGHYDYLVHLIARFSPARSQRDKDI